MLPLSVIIICKNEVVNISDCIIAAKLITSDIVVVDSGSDDGTVEIARSLGINLIETEWKGYGYARNLASEAATNDWILAIDTDERVTDSLVKSINQIEILDNSTIYGFKRMNFFLGKKMRFGKWGRDKSYRLYNKKHISWDNSPVHETLIGKDIKKEFIKGHIEHYPVRNLEDNNRKMYKYAQLNADNYFAKGRKATLIKRYLSPLSDFIQSYILFLGILDGKEGFIVSFSNAHYTYLKYHYLLKMNKQSGRQ